jgi:hypothetical protein
MKQVLGFSDEFIDQLEKCPGVTLFPQQKSICSAAMGHKKKICVGSIPS